MFNLAVTTYTCVCDLSSVSLTAVSTDAAVGVRSPYSQAAQTQLGCICVCLSYPLLYCQRCVRTAATALPLCTVTSAYSYTAHSNCLQHLLEVDGSVVPSKAKVVAHCTIDCI
jgi:hypothetical protein